MSRLPLPAFQGRPNVTEITGADFLAANRVKDPTDLECLAAAFAAYREAITAALCPQNKYPWDTIAVGEWFTVPREGKAANGADKVQSRLSARISQIHRRSGKRYTTRARKGFIQVTRVE